MKEGTDYTPEQWARAKAYVRKALARQHPSEELIAATAKKVLDADPTLHPVPTLEELQTEEAAA